MAALFALPPQGSSRLPPEQRQMFWYWEQAGISAPSIRMMAAIDPDRNTMTEAGAVQLIVVAPSWTDTGINYLGRFQQRGRDGRPSGQTSRQ